MLTSFFSLLTLLMGLSLVNAAPLSNSTMSNSNMSIQTQSAAATSWWLPNLPQNGALPFGGSSSYKIYRNVKDYGAKGDGNTDDTAAINAAVSDGGRCGLGCDSSTTTPALVYFPPGTYRVSKPIIQYYFTQFIGDAINIPVIKALPGFQGIAVIDSDPYTNTGANWYTNQNNFYRQVRNFVIDLTALPQTTGTGIHWQVAQATSLQNIRFEMIRGGGSANKQQGIFMDNGSGGALFDLTFNGGGIGAFFGNQQFTTRNLIFNGCNTAIIMNWNWLWSFQGITISNCGTGIDMSTGGSSQQGVGSILLQDSKITGTPVGVRTAWTQSSSPVAGGTLVIDNTDFTGSQVAVANVNGGTILAGGGLVQSWIQGRRYQGSNGARVQGTQSASNKPAALLSNGKVFARSKPQYENVPASSFVSVKSRGAKGDGSTDDTAAIQNAMNSVGSGGVLFFDYGAYIVSSPITVPANIRIVGQLWPMIMAKGSAFQNQNSPQPVFRVGQAGQSGAVEMSDLVFQTVGPQPGATLVEWNLGASSQGSNGMWDVHMRIGGSAGTQLQSDKCTKNPGTIAPANPACEGAFLMLHVTRTGSVYVENQWAWVADHELDRGDHNQINIFNGRGVLVESTAPTWFIGHASEHSTLYNYNLHNAQNVFMSAIQTETPYFQANPDATTPFTAQTAIGDPTFAGCGSGDPLCKKSWGMTVSGSSNVFVYGAGMYSFFDNWDQTCLATNDCQTNMISVDNSNNVHLYGISTKAAKNMITANGQSQALDADNRSNFCGTLALWTA